MNEFRRSCGRVAALLAVLLGGVGSVVGQPDEGWPEGSVLMPWTFGGEIPPPTPERAVTGEPGSAYWQQRADLVIQARLDAEARRIEGWLELTYHNRSPHTLPFLWLQLESNALPGDSPSVTMDGWWDVGEAEISEVSAGRVRARRDWKDGLQLGEVVDAADRPLRVLIRGTLARVDLAEPLAPGAVTKVKLSWSAPVPEGTQVAERGGYEVFEDGGDIFQLTQWYPRVAAFSDVQGWHLRPYFGAGEFASEFGDHELHLDVPEGFVVAATGELINPEEAIGVERAARLRTLAAGGDRRWVVSPEEARAAVASPVGEGRRTWIFRASNVRDNAWASSRRFAWEARRLEGVGPSGQPVLLQAAYGPEVESLWGGRALDAMAHALRFAAREVGPYPYPVLWAVHGPEYGMEYPMMTLQSNRPSPGEEMTGEEILDFVDVVIHESLHTWFPMVVNTDEREWGWMDEGFVTYLTDRAMTNWSREAAQRVLALRVGRWSELGGESDGIVMDPPDVAGDGWVIYDKPAELLHLLRGAVLGPEVFDDVFREYVRRWSFRRATPADFIRTVEQVGGVRLDALWLDWLWGHGQPRFAVAAVAPWQILEEAEPGAEVGSGDKPAKRGVRPPRPNGDALWVASIVNETGFRLPVVVEITYEDRVVERREIPLEAWLEPGTVVDLALRDVPPVSVVIDPDEVLPLADRSRCTWEP